MIRIANGQGFWGDWLEAPVRLVEQGPIDYLGLDYLAEITMSILQKQKQDDPRLGYARDFPPLIGRIAGQIRERDVKIVANAGGVNPITGRRVIQQPYVKYLLSIMHSCGMYDYAGEWAFRIGIPSKSGVGGGIVGVIPGQF